MILIVSCITSSFDELFFLFSFEASVTTDSNFAIGSFSKSDLTVSSGYEQLMKENPVNLWKLHQIIDVVSSWNLDIWPSQILEDILKIWKTTAPLIK